MTDARFDVGMSGQQALLAEATGSGAQQVGWKAGLGSPAARTTLAIDAPLVGFLLDATRVDPGATVAVSGWTAPRAEAEIALRLGSDVAADADPDTAIAKVAAVAVAIELVDLAPPPTDVAATLAGNIFHRHWATGPFLPVDGPLRFDGATARVHAMGEDLDVVSDVEAATGRAGDVLAEVARMAARYGRGLRGGDVVILGSMVPPHPVGPGGTFRVALDGHEPIELRLA